MQTPALGINYVYRIRASLYPVLISVITSFCERLTEHNTQMKGTNSAKCTIYVSSEMLLCPCLQVKWQQTMETRKNESTKGNNCISFEFWPVCEKFVFWAPAMHKRFETHNLAKRAHAK